MPTPTPKPPAPASPLPWRTEDAWIMDATGRTIAETDRGSGNAEKIVQSANAYPALLAERDALREALRTLEAASAWHADARDGRPDINGSRLRDALAQARAILSTPHTGTKEV